ncbi:hypothetical protein BMS3Abin02_00815 [bacterium BMS3Abin02]|nr:hypothetical protein BMS3Abin02_00815 [bacterium BMS3Abin02]GBE23320.1 hypothetical protein BMS3Bbin01_02704 [bacterium BMS3Bbin01]HDH24655.1 ABC transporter substrate-binding protein [Actinomycetota bacterium]HDL49537.1 ABC transporter substrate-binding protein [Actinomycetota bacterium]
MSQNWRRSWAVLALFVVLALIAAACGGATTETTAAAPSANATTTSTTAAATAQAGDVIKLGVLATLEGPFVEPGKDGIRGVYMALAEYGGDSEGKGAVVAGHPIEVYVESTDATAEVARDKARKLFEEDNVDIIIGPLSGDEGINLARYMQGVPDKTMLNGTSAAQDTTMDPAIRSKQFFRWGTDGVQWQAGLGSYAYNEKGYRKMVTLGEDYSFPYSQVEGFMIEFCREGGTVAKKLWTPLGETDYSSIIAEIQGISDLDAVYVALGGNDAINFLTQMLDFGLDLPLVGGSITVDQSILGAKAPRIREVVIGTPAAGPIADDIQDQVYVDWVKAYQTLWEDGKDYPLTGIRFPLPSLFAHGYYVDAKAALLALEKVDGDLSGGQEAFREALRGLEYESPTGMVSVDKNQNAIANEYVTEVTERADGVLYNKLVKVAEQVNQTLGEPEDFFFPNGTYQGPSREYPSCP